MESTCSRGVTLTTGRQEVTVTTPTEPLTLTGERTAPGIWHEIYWFTVT